MGCGGCTYSWNLRSCDGTYCQYILVTGTRRPCPATGCTVRAEEENRLTRQYKKTVLAESGPSKIGFEGALMAKAAKVRRLEKRKRKKLTLAETAKISAIAAEILKGDT